jgi:hypothetical protein
MFLSLREPECRKNNNNDLHFSHVDELIHEFPFAFSQIYSAFDLNQKKTLM